MLRSQGIPARVVLGYRCEEWNNLGKFYQVRQSDAHAWVEAYLAAREHPAGAALGRRRSPLGRRGVAAAGRHAGGLRTGRAFGSRSKSGQGRNWIDSLWSDYVMEMDRQRQNEAVYQPLIADHAATARNMCTIANGGEASSRRSAIC